MQQLQGYGSPSAAGTAPVLEIPTFELESAGFGIRAMAQCIDAVFTMASAYVGGIFAGIALAVIGSAGWEQRVGGVHALGMILSVLATVAYHTLAEGMGGATLGKQLCGLRVLSDDARPCTVQKALVRSAAFYLDALFFGIPAWSSMSKSPIQQRNGDRWAGTRVVKAHSIAHLSVQSPLAGIAVGTLAYTAISATGTLLAGL